MTAVRGPLRVVTPEAELPAARLRVLQAVARHEPATTIELSRSLGGHENTTRQHLEALGRDGFVHGEQNRGRMGRPSVSYSLSPSGLRHLAGRAASPEHAALVAALAERIVETCEDPVAEARGIGLAWGRRLAAVDDLDDAPGEATSSGEDGRASDAVTMARDLLESLGFSPVVHDDGPRGAPADDAPALLLRTCPLLDAARERPEVVCTVHEGLVEGYLRSRGSGADVEVTPFFQRAGCRATIRD